MLLNQDEKYDLTAFRAHIIYELGSAKNKIIRAILQGNLLALDSLIGDIAAPREYEVDSSCPWLVTLIDRMYRMVKIQSFGYPSHLCEMNEKPVLCVRSSDLLRFARRDEVLKKALPEKVTSHTISRMLKKEGVIQGSEKEVVVDRKRYSHMKILDVVKMEAFIDKHIDRSVP